MTRFHFLWWSNILLLEKEMVLFPALVLLLPGKSHGQRSFMGYNPWGCKRVGCDLATTQQQYSVIYIYIYIYIYSYTLHLLHPFIHQWALSCFHILAKPLVPLDSQCEKHFLPTPEELGLLGPTAGSRLQPELTSGGERGAPLTDEDIEAQSWVTCLRTPSQGRAKTKGPLQRRG